MNYSTQSAWDYIKDDDFYASTASAENLESLLVEDQEFKRYIGSDKSKPVDPGDINYEELYKKLLEPKKRPLEAVKQQTAITPQVNKEQGVGEQIGGLSKSQVALVKRTVAKGATDDELAMFIHIAKKYDLDPMNKEIWFYKVKDRRSGEEQTIIFTSRDGFLKIAHQSGNFGGIQSACVRKNDEITIDYSSSRVNHKINPTEDRGVIMGAWAIVYAKNTEPVIEWVDFTTYNKGWNVWKTHPEEMIKKVAETHALKKMFGISGLQGIEEKDSIEDKTPAKADKKKKVVELEVVDEYELAKKKLFKSLEVETEEDALKKLGLKELPKTKDEIFNLLIENNG